MGWETEALANWGSCRAAPAGERSCRWSREAPLRVVEADWVYTDLEAKRLAPRRKGRMADMMGESSERTELGAVDRMEE